MREFRAESVARVAGIMVAIVGGVTLAGWLGRWEFIVSVFPGSIAMQRNTALGLLVCGLGIVALGFRRRLISLSSGVFGLLLGLATAVEFATGFNLKIDEILGKYDFGHPVSPPGRMSPITTLCFMGAGVALILLSGGRSSRIRSWFAGILGSLLAGIGFVTCLGYAVGFPKTFTWYHFGNIAFMTSLSFAIVGASLMVSAWNEALREEGLSPALNRHRVPEWFPLSIGIVILTTALGAWQALVAGEVTIRPLLPDIVFAGGTVLALVFAMIVHRMRGAKGSPAGTVLAGAGLALATLVAVGIVQYRSMRSLIESDVRVAHTHRVLTELESAYSDLQRAESGMRGYVATGQAIYLTQHEDGKSDSQVHIQTLRQLTSDNLQQQKNLHQLENLFQRKIIQLAELENTRREEGPIQATRLLALNTGLENMNAIRSMVDEMESEEEKLLVVRQSASQSGAREAALLMVLGTLLALGFVSAAGWVARRDGLQRQLAETKFRQLNRALRTISECNQAMVKAQDESALLQNICRILVEDGGYRMVWVGFAQDDEARSVRPVAQWGADEGYLAEAKICWADNERGREPTGKAIRFGRSIIARRTADEPDFGPWRAAAQLHGFASSIALPLFLNASPMGALTLYSAQSDAFDENEVKLLTELSHDLAYGLRALRTKADRQRAEVALLESKRRLDLAQQAGRMGSWEWIIPEGKVIYTPEMEAIYGLPPGGMKGLYENWRNAVHPEDISRVESELRGSIEAGKEFDSEYRIVWPDQSIHWMAARGALVRDGDSQSFRMVGINVDITGRKQAEEELRLSRERLALALQSGNSGTFEWNMQTNENMWSPEIETLYGIEPGSFGKTYRDWEALVLPEDLPAAREAIQQALKTGNFRGEWRIRRPSDGQIRWLSAGAKIFPDDSGRPLLMMGINTDITERKQVEARLLESETAFRTLADAIPQMVWMCTPDGMNIYFNQRWVDYTGLPLEESYGRGWSTPFHPDDTPAAWDAWSHATATGETYHIESRLRASDGTYRWFLLRGVPLRDAEGRIHKWFGTCTDIEDMKRAEEQLATQARIAEIFLTVPDDEMYGEVLKVILRAMKSKHGVFGYIDENGANVVPSMTRDIWDKCQVPQKDFVFPRATWGDSSWVRALLEKKPNFTNTTATKTPPGHIAVERHISLPIMFQGEAIGLLQVANSEEDYTDGDVRRLDQLAERIAPILSARMQRERAENQIRRMNEELEQRVRDRTAELEAINKELEAFTYSVSHDLRAPLRHIDGFSKMLMEEDATALSDDAKRYLEHIRAGTQQMGRLIDDLLNLARVGRKELSLQVAGLTSLTEEVVAQLNHDNPGRTLQWNVAPLPFIECDPGLMKQVFANLLSNAVKFTRPRATARVEVGVTEKDGAPVIFVRDNGVGFSMKYADKLFGVFQRLHRMEDFEGTGVGLATVQRIIHKHGGHVWAEAELDKGATFYFTLGGEKAEGRKQKAEGEEKAA